MQYGRAVLYTDAPEITYENVIDVVRKNIAAHERNAADIDRLLRYDAGEQEQTRVKTFRSDIDNWCVDNIANEAVEFWLGFAWGNPITSLRKSRKQAILHTHKTIFTRILHGLIHGFIYRLFKNEYRR